jgi:hypothetical protein
MKPPPFIVTFLPGIAGFFGMAALGWHLAAPFSTAGKTSGKNPGELAQHDYRKPRASPSSERSIVAAQVRVVRDAGSPVERMRAAVALANSVSPADFAAWAEGDRFNFRKGPELSVFRMILFERWIKEDPESLIPWAGKNNYGQAGRALIAFAKNEPQRLIDHYRSHPEDQGEMQILKEVAKDHPDLALQRLQEISAAGISTGAPRLARDLLEQLAKKSPAELQAALATLSPELRKKAESALSGERMAASFSSEVHALWERPDGWEIFSDAIGNNSERAAGLIEDIANLPEGWRVGMAENPYSFVSGNSGRKWFDADLEAAGFSTSQAKDIRRAALEQLAGSDPEFALKNLSAPGVDQYVRANVISNVLRGAKGDGAQIEKLIGSMTSEEDKQTARDQLKLTELNAEKTAERKPQEWLQKLAAITNAADDPYSALSQIQNWDKTKFAELRDGFKDLPPEQQQNIARVVAAAGDFSQIDPGFAGDAIRSLVLNPPAVISEDNRHNPNMKRDSPVMASSTYAVRLAESDPTAATTWINTLPDGAAKQWAYKNVAANWRQSDPAAVDDWVKTLPAATREQVTQHLKKQR